MIVKRLTYRGFPIEVHYYAENDDFSAYSYHLSSYTHEQNVFANPRPAIKSLKKKIDEFIKEAPSDYIQLAVAIEESLVWDGYEDCHVEPKTLEMLVEAFLKVRES